MASKTNDKNQTALAGEHAVLSQLALLGYDAAMTLGNTKRVDILIRNPNTGGMYGLEVKTSTLKKEQNSKDFGKCFKWQMNIKHESIKDKNLFYCFVSTAGSYSIKDFRFFIVPSEVVADYVKIQHEYWLGIDETRKEKETKMRAFRLGLNGNKYNIVTPLVEDHEDKWGEYLKKAVTDNRQQITEWNIICRQPITGNR